MPADRESITDPNAVIASTRRGDAANGRGSDQSRNDHQFSRGQLIQLVLIGALVYVAYPFISTVPTLRTSCEPQAVGATGLAVSALTYVGAAAAL